MTRERVLVAMSGGVDSSVAALTTAADIERVCELIPALALKARGFAGAP